MADNTDPGHVPKGHPWETAVTVKQEWASKDVELLLSGDYSDAVVICKDNPTRKVHRGILSRRSHWFREAFADADTNGGYWRIEIDEYSWSVDFILYFFYVGYINMADTTLTAGYSEMVLGVKLLRLGNTLQEKSLQYYGYDLLQTHLSRLIEHFCDPSATTEENEKRSNEVPGFICQFFWAIRNAFDEVRPVGQAQNLLASFAYNARAHLFKNEPFVSFIREKEVPEFGNMLLDALMTLEYEASLVSEGLQFFPTGTRSNPPGPAPGSATSSSAGTPKVRSPASTVDSDLDFPY